MNIKYNKHYNFTIISNDYFQEFSATFLSTVHKWEVLKYFINNPSL